MVEYLPGDEPVRVRHGALDTLHALLGALPIAYFLLAVLMDVTYVRSTYFLWPIFSILSRMTRMPINRPTVTASGVERSLVPSSSLSKGPFRTR